MRALLERVLDALMTTGTLRASQQAKETAAIEAIRAELAKPQGEPVAWLGAKTLYFNRAFALSNGEQYLQPLYLHPAHTEAEAIELDRLAAFIHTASCPEEVAMALAEHGEAVRRILGVSKP